MAAAKAKKKELAGVINAPRYKGRVWYRENQGSRIVGGAECTSIGIDNNGLYAKICCFKSNDLVKVGDVIKLRAMGGYVRITKMVEVNKKPNWRKADGVKHDFVCNWVVVTIRFEAILTGSEEIDGRDYLVIYDKVVDAFFTILSDYEVNGKVVIPAGRYYADGRHA